MRGHTLSVPCVLLIGACLVGFAGNGFAATVPFTEDFDLGPADWYDFPGTAPVIWAATGGPDGGAYVTGTYFVPDPPPPFGVSMFRAQDEFNSSGGAFEGDWVADGVKQLSFFIRHDALQPIDVFARFTTPDNFPGAVGILFAPIPAGVWTEVTIDVTPTSPQIILECCTYDDTFTNIGHLQIGIVPTVDFVGQLITVDLDKVTIIPAPGALVISMMGTLLLGRRRRRPHTSS